jgi:hypothetical protein
MAGVKTTEHAPEPQATRPPPQMERVVAAPAAGKRRTRGDAAFHEAQIESGRQMRAFIAEHYGDIE